MAVALTVRNRYKLGNSFIVTADAAFSGTYTTGGESFTAASIGLTAITDVYVHPAEDGSANAYVARWNGSTSAPKIKLFIGDNNNASDGPLIENPNATSLTGVASRVLIFGY